MTKLDQLLNLLHNHPGLTRKEIRECIGFSEMNLDMYLSSMYGYRIGRKMMDNTRPEYLCHAEYKPAKGKRVYQYFLTDLGQARVRRNMSNSSS